MGGTAVALRGMAAVASESPRADPVAVSTGSAPAVARPDEPAIRPKKNATARDPRRVRKIPTACRAVTEIW